MNELLHRAPLFEPWPEADKPVEPRAGSKRSRRSLWLALSLRR